MIDNASNDASLAYVKAHYPELPIIKNKSNIGFAKAVNIGINLTKSDYILLLNPDTELLSDRVDGMIAFMDANPYCGAMGGRVLYPDGRRQESYRNFPTLWTIALGRRSSLFYRLFPQNPFAKKYLLPGEDFSHPAEVDFVAGTFMMLRRKAINEIGLFDENFFLYVEDVDLCWRLKKQGWKVCFYPMTSCRHHYGEKIRNDNIHPEIHHARSMFKFFKKNYQPNWFTLLILKLGLYFKIMQILSWGFAKKTLAR